MRVLKTCGYNHWSVLAQGGLNIGYITCFPKLDADEEDESCWDISSDTNTHEDEANAEDDTGDELDMGEDEEVLENKTEVELDTTWLKRVLRMRLMEKWRWTMMR
jgi:hypothetical protein